MAAPIERGAGHIQMMQTITTTNIGGDGNTDDMCYDLRDI